MPSSKTPAESAAPRANPSRRGLLIALGVLAVGVGATQWAWRASLPQLRKLPQHQVTAASIRVTPQPEWLRCDVKTEALYGSGLLGAANTAGLSILDPSDRLEARIAEALAFHPWVARVGRLRKLPPNQVHVEVEYRSPVAAVQTRDSLTPLDAGGYTLPPAGLAPIELGYLPRVNLSDSVLGRQQPRVGAVWESDAIRGAIALVARFGQAWESLHLLDISPSASPEVRGDHRYYVYELRTKEGTSITWGAAPEMGPPSESSFQQKQARLRAFIAEHGPLDSVRSPKRIDVRDTLRFEPRIAKDDATKTARAPSDEAIK